MCLMIHDLFHILFNTSLFALIKQSINSATAVNNRMRRRRWWNHFVSANEQLSKINFIRTDCETTLALAKKCVQIFWCQLFSRLLIFIYFRAFVARFHGNRIFLFQSLFTMYCEREWSLTVPNSKECACEKALKARSMHRHVSIVRLRHDAFLETYLGSHKYENLGTRWRMEPPKRDNIHDRLWNCEKRLLTQLTISTGGLSTCGRTRRFEWIGMVMLSMCIG